MPKPHDALKPYTLDMNDRGRKTVYNLLRQLFREQTVVQDGHLGWSDAVGKHISYAIYSHQRKMVLRVKGISAKGGGIHVTDKSLWPVIYPESRDDAQVIPQPMPTAEELHAVIGGSAATSGIQLDTPLEMMAIRTFYEAAIASYCQADPRAASFFNNVRQRADKLFGGNQS